MNKAAYMFSVLVLPILLSFVGALALVGGATAGASSLGLLGGVATVASVPAAATSVLAGDYIEARTASVWAGGCHYSAEEPVTGRDAVMAWNFASGDWNGVNLSGVAAVAVVTSDANLDTASAARKYELMVDSSATLAQVRAVSDLIATRYSDSVGTLAATTRGPISFVHEGSEYKVSAKDFASVNAKALPDGACCFQTESIWYQPLVSLKNAEVGYTIRSSYSGGALGDRWTRNGENSAFYGAFEIK